MSRRYVTKQRLAEMERQLTKHDLAIVRRVCGLRFVSGSQLSRLHFDGNAQPARRALLKLTRLDVLERLERRIGGNGSGSAAYVYRLGLVGQRLATAHGWQPARRRRRSHIPGTLFLAHTLQVAELHTLLTEAERSGRIELLALASEPACWRQLRGMANGQRSTFLKPDSFVRLGDGDYEVSTWIEIDRGTEGSRAIDTKLRQYLAYEASGKEQAERGVFPKTLWLTPTPKRAAAIAACIRVLPGPAHELFEVAVFDDALAVLGADGGAGKAA